MNIQHQPHRGDRQSIHIKKIEKIEFKIELNSTKRDTRFFGGNTYKGVVIVLLTVVVISACLCLLGINPEDFGFFVQTITNSFLSIIDSS